MKFFWIFIYCFALNNLQSQTDTVRLYQIYNSFSNEEKAEWTSFENNWHYFEFSAIQKKFKIKGLNCKNCESLFSDLYIEIDATGKVTVSHFLKGRKCGIEINDEEFKSAFEKSLLQKRFLHIKNKKFISRFGNALKC